MHLPTFYIYRDVDERLNATERFGDVNEFEEGRAKGGALQRRVHPARARS